MTSGGPSPTLNKNIGLCYLPIDKAPRVCDPSHDPQFAGRSRDGSDSVLQESKTMSYPDTYKYTKEHEWVHFEGDIGTIGITDHAQHELGDIVFVDLAKNGHQVSKGETFGSVESVKAVSDIYSPVRAKSPP